MKLKIKTNQRRTFKLRSAKREQSFQNLTEHGEQNATTDVGFGDLTAGDVAEERMGRIPPQARTMLSTICDTRWMVLCTKMMLSFELMVSSSVSELLRKELSKKTGLRFFLFENYRALELYFLI